MKIINENKKAYFDYFIEEKFEAGIRLTGAEVKSIRLGQINLKDSFCHISNGEVYLKNCHISPYLKGSVFNEDPKRDRKLLLHKSEISRLIGKVKEKGFTLLPVKVYFVKNKVKLEIGLGKGKHTFDKSKSLKEKDLLRQAQRDIKSLQ